MRRLETFVSLDCAVEAMEMAVLQDKTESDANGKGTTNCKPHDEK